METGALEKQVAHWNNNGCVIIIKRAIIYAALNRKFIMGQSRGECVDLSRSGRRALQRLPYRLAMSETFDVK